MPFIKGIIFSSALLDECQALRDQLQLLSWCGLQLAALSPEVADSPSANVPSTVKFGCEALSVLQLPAAEAGADGGGPAAAEAAAASWAAGQGLRWPEEVVLLGTSADEVGQLHLKHVKQQQQRDGEGGGDAWEVLPGFNLESGEGAEAAPWSRLRLALAHANLQRALADSRSETEPAPSSGPLLIVATAMKASRERDLAREGLLSLVPQDGVVFAPLDLSAPLEQQLPFHVILHKASDELEYGEDGVPRFGARVRGLADFAAVHPEISLVDPLEAAAKVINRTELARVCDALSSLDLGDDVEGVAATPGTGVQQRCGGGGGGGGGAAAGDSDGLGPPGAKRPRLGPGAAVRVRVRAPRNTPVASFSREEVEAARARLGCPPPYIVKPVVACGTSDSHQMALVLLAEGLEGLPLPLPAVVQEFVNHDATIYKAYVAGDKVFHTVRPSIPNLPRDRAAAEQVAPSGVLLFDSLKSLPTALHRPATAADAATAAPAPAAPLQSPPSRSAAPSQAVLERLAAFLRSQLGLSLFGFDVVVASHDTRRELKEVEGVKGAGGGEGGGDGEQQQQQEQRVGDDEEEGEVLDLVVVDVNYFPSYRGAQGAPDLFRAAIKGAHRRQQQGRQQ